MSGYSLREVAPRWERLSPGSDDLADDLTALEDRRRALSPAIDRFSAWKFGRRRAAARAGAGRSDASTGEPARSPYFNTCALAVA